MGIEELRDIFREQDKVMIDKKQFEVLSNEMKALQIQAELSELLLAKEVKRNKSLGMS